MERHRIINESINEIEEYFINLMENMHYLGFTDEASETVLDEAEKIISQLNDEIVNPSTELFGDLFALLETDNEDVN